MIAFALIVVACLLALWYKKVTNKQDFWKIQKVPYVEPRPIVGSVLIPFHENKPLHEIEMEWYNTYGRIYGRFEGSEPVFCVGDPDILKSVLVKDFQFFPNRRDMKFHDPIMDNTLFVLEGESWKRVRNIVTPTFTTAKLKKMIPLLTESCDVLIERLRESNKSVGIIDCQKHLEGFVLHAIGRCAFGMKMDTLKDPNNSFITKARKLFQERWSLRTFLTLFCPRLMKIFRIKLLNPETTQFYKNIIIDVLEERKRNNVVQNDFLQMLLDAEEVPEDKNNNENTECPEGICNETSAPKKPANNRKRLSHDEVISQSITFFIAGFEPTTTLISMILYNLAVNPDYQNRVVEEMITAMENNKGDICYEALSEMKFTDAVINECLRMCPAMVRAERRCQADYDVEGKDIHLKKDMIVSIPVYAIHHDPEWYPNPYEFKPERFYEPDPNRPQYVHLPFGAGNRMCVGMRFVQMQVKLCLAKILTKFEILRAPTTPASLKYIESRNILSVGKVEVCIKERSFA